MKLLRVFLLLTHLLFATDVFAISDCTIYLDPQSGSQKPLVRMQDLPQGIWNYDFQELVEYVGERSRKMEYFAQSTKEIVGRLLFEKAVKHIEASGLLYKLVPSQAHGGNEAFEFPTLTAVLDKRRLEARATYDPIYLIDRNVGGVFSEHDARLYLGHRDVADFKFYNDVFIHELLHGETRRDEREGRMPHLGGYSSPTTGRLPSPYWLENDHYDRGQSHDEVSAYLRSLKSSLKAFDTELGLKGLLPDSRHIWQIERNIKFGLSTTARLVKIAEAHIHQWENPLSISFEYEYGLVYLDFASEISISETQSKFVRSLIPLRRATREETARWEKLMGKAITAFKLKDGQFKFELSEDRLSSLYRSESGQQSTWTDTTEEDRIQFHRTMNEVYPALIRFHTENYQYLRMYERAYEEFKSLKAAALKNKKAAVRAARSRIYQILLAK